MATQSGHIEDERFSNWIKDTLALIYTKECLEVIADERSAVFHGQLKAAVGHNPTCTCIWQDLNADRKRQKWVVKNCPRMCQNWLDIIISHHSNRPLPKLAPRNTDPRLWPSDTWEVMKLYQSKGCQGHHSARDADLAALIDLIRNCDYFAPLITNPSLVNQVIDIRNNLMHSKDCLVENHELPRDLQSILDFLDSLISVTGEHSLSDTERQAVQTAITEVDKLRKGVVDLTLNRELQLKALTAKQVALETEMKALEQTMDDTREDTAAEISSLQQQFDVLKLIHDDTKKTMTALIQQIEVACKIQQLQAQAHASKLEQQQGELDTHTAKLVQLDQRNEELDTHKTTLQDHETQLIGQHIQIESQQKTLDNHGAQLDRLENKQVAHQTEQPVDIKRIQRGLISLYETQRLHIPVYLMRSERKVPIEDIYVEQRLKVVDPDGRLTTDSTVSYSRHRTRSDIIRIGAQGRPIADKMEKFISSLRDVFYCEENRCRYVYVSGNAGYGKSVFCSHLVRLWCKAHSEIKTKVTPDADFMAEFPLLFCVDLKDASYTATDQMPDEICSLIHKQLQLNQLGLTDNDLSNLLQADGQVLVVMDALDECKEERLPRGGLYNKCTTIVTSRPWKLEALRCNRDCKVEKELEIVGLKKGSPENLSENLVKLLNKKWKRHKTSSDFIKHMLQEDLEEFLNVPVLLTSMLCMWFDDVPFGKSRCEMYRNSIHHQVLATMQAKGLSEYSSPSENSFPLCQGESCQCKCYGKLLWKVSWLACKALFGNVRERSLVMNHAQTEFLGLIDEKEVAICMKLGILTQYKLLGNVTDYEPQKSVSFTHKTYQEWFAAVHLSSEQNMSELDTLLSESSADLDSALELDQLYLFVCGLNAEVAAKLSEFIMSKASSDTMVQEYRISNDINTGHEHLIRTIQDVVVAGAAEAIKNNQESIALQLHDVYIDGSSKRFSREQILACDTSDVKSVCIVLVNESKITPWPSSSCLEKLMLRNVSNALDDTFCDNFSASHMVVLHLDNVTLGHDQLESLCVSLASAESLKTVDIRQLTCNDHKANMQNCNIQLDFSQYINFQKITQKAWRQRPNINVIEWPPSSGIKTIDLRRVDISLCKTFCTNLDVGNESIISMENVNMTHYQLQTLCERLATAKRLQTVDISQLTCIAHKDNKHDCYIQLDFSQYISFEKLTRGSWRQRPTIQITSWPSSSYMETVDLRHVDISSCDTFRTNLDISNVSNLYLEDVELIHDQLESLFESLASAGTLRTIDNISQLTCITHKDNRQDCNIMLDLSQHQGLETLTLWNVGVGEMRGVSLSQKMEKLKNVKLGNVKLAHDQLESLCGSLSTSVNLRRVNIIELTCMAHNDRKKDCGLMLDFSRHQGLELLTLRNLGVGDVRGVSLCQEMHNMEEVELHNMTLTHDQLESLCRSLASVRGLKTVDIKQLTCISHKDSRQDCYIHLAFSQYISFVEITQAWWQRPIVKITSLPSSSFMETVDLRQVDMSSCDTFCSNLEEGNVSSLYLYRVKLAHDQLKTLCGSRTSVRNLRTVNIIELTCTTHKNNRQDCNVMFDLCQHRELEHLALRYIGVGEVQGVRLCQNMDKLNTLWLGGFCISASALRQTLDDLPGHRVQVEMGGLGVPPLRVRGTEEARTLLEKIKQETCVDKDDVQYTDEECVVMDVRFTTKHDDDEEEEQ